MSEENQPKRSRKKKIIYSLVAVLLVFTVIFYVVANSVLDRLSRQAMIQLSAEADQRGTDVLQPSFESVWLSGFLSATWSGLRANVKRQAKEGEKAGRIWKMQVNRITIDWDIGGQASLDGYGISIVGTKSEEREKESSEKRIELGHFGCEFPLDLLDAKTAIKQLLTELMQLTEDGTIGLPLELDGKVVFAFKNKPTELRMQAAQQGDNMAVVLVREDVAALSTVFDEKLTDAEVDLIATHPRRAPRLLEIKDDAESTSAQASQRDATVPQDAYRHVLWSFLLTREYDADFAKQVGDAHEAGDTGNTEAEREMDYQNNAAGRKYAEQKISRRDLLRRLLNDPAVRKSP